MKRIINIGMVLVAMLLACSTTAQLRLASPLKSSMVLLQQSDAKLWGEASKGATITVTTSFSEASYSAKADNNGLWELYVATPEGSYTPHTITISDGHDSITLEDVLIGEIWLASGQSNMEMQMKGYSGQPVKGATDMIMTAKPSVPIRSCNVKRVLALEPAEECEATWYEHTPVGVREASATAYMFARST